VSLNHRFDGRDDAPVVVLSNSLGTTLSMWEPQLPALTTRFRVLRYDQRGHGASGSPPGPYSFDDLGRDVLQLLDGLGLDRVSFCGVSMGGMTGMWLGANAPERVDRLVLSCTSAGFGSPETWEERMELVRREGVGALVEATMERWFTAEFRSRRPEVVERFARWLATTDREGYLACCAALRDWDFAARLPEISAPALVIAGQHDPSTPPEHGQLIAESVPGARLLVLEAAHIANVERADEWNAAVLEHLS
jgi:3-oxoadipate enol-lactonase